MRFSSNAVDPIVGFLGRRSDRARCEEKAGKYQDQYTGADNDEFMKELVEDYGTKDEQTLGNPTGTVLTKFNGERATRKFIHVALKVPEGGVDSWIDGNFCQAWSKYDVNDSGKIDEAMAPTYFRSLLGDFTTQFGLSDEERFRSSLRNP